MRTDRQQPFKQQVIDLHLHCWHALWLLTLLLLFFSGPAPAASLIVNGTLYQQQGGTTFDTWKINMQAAGTFTVDLLAYEASQSSTSTAGYFTGDLNGDGELTWLDPDTYFYIDDGHLDAVDGLVRCDDINNNCAVYQNGLTAATSPVTVISRSQAQGATDGSIHFRRDPAYDVTAAAGNYLFLVADFRLTTTEAEGGINAGDTFSSPTGFASPVLDHADYRVAFSGEGLNFSINGNTITVSAVPVPAAFWLFGSALGFLATRRRIVRA
jgi:hypothetical protein